MQIIPYRKAQAPTLESTLSNNEQLYYDQQLTNIQKSITSIIASIQSLTPGASITVVSQSLTGINGGFAGYNDRLVIPASLLNPTYTGFGLISITLSSSASSSAPVLDEIWVGHSDGTGTNGINLDGGAVQLLFGGSASHSFSGAVNFTTDTKRFYYNPSKPLIVSTHWSGTGASGNALNSGAPTNCNNYLFGASQAGVRAPTGSWSFDSSWTWVSAITLLETP